MGKEFFEGVLEPAWKRLADRFGMMRDQGLLRRADPWVAAMHWKGLNEWDIFEKRLLGAIDGPDQEVLQKTSTLAADAFLQLYGPQTGAKKTASHKPARDPGPSGRGS